MREPIPAVFVGAHITFNHAASEEQTDLSTHYGIYMYVGLYVCM